jgi:hypothetical protein
VRVARAANLDLGRHSAAGRRRAKDSSRGQAGDITTLDFFGKTDILLQWSDLERFAVQTLTEQARSIIRAISTRILLNPLL